MWAWAWAIMRIDTFTAVPPLPDGKVAKQVVAGNDHTMVLWRGWHGVRLWG